MKKHRSDNSQFAKMAGKRLRLNVLGKIKSVLRLKFIGERPPLRQAGQPLYTMLLDDITLNAKQYESKENFDLGF